ncbi:hypothetical protein NEOLI_004287 [Neolecta irregularis DAH-3]|uniref:5'-3' DNA helicase ZGRF1-like N-terminal domain-containing protein n=1 Tax=Neolecta irregularis (strain DAH-3) TaxID=1198029 RepID=A0A1U7LJJ7_NEOID|nr:hypothetical protein NEOLI_004287 [Neolecta irregularis DAH-3]|eukprot:OLL22722.1 hypothetical protein NEOLI_004287 [Neolecta irregularis DAH-3]
MTTITADGHTTAQVHQYTVLYTPQKVQKAKCWHDGYMKHHTFNSRLTLYDSNYRLLDDLFIPGRSVEEGDDFEFERYLTAVGTKCRSETQDITPIFSRKSNAQTPRNTAKAKRLGALPRPKPYPSPRTAPATPLPEKSHNLPADKCLGPVDQSTVERVNVSTQPERNNAQTPRSTAKTKRLGALPRPKPYPSPRTAPATPLPEKSRSYQRFINCPSNKLVELPTKAPTCLSRAKFDERFTKISPSHHPIPPDASDVSVQNDQSAHGKSFLHNLPSVFHQNVDRSTGPEACIGKITRLPKPSISNSPSMDASRSNRGLSRRPLISSTTDRETHNITPQRGILSLAAPISRKKKILHMRSLTVKKPSPSSTVLSPWHDEEAMDLFSSPDI